MQCTLCSSMDSMENVRSDPPKKCQIGEHNNRWGWARSLRENTKASKDSFMAEVMAVWSG